MTRGTKIRLGDRERTLRYDMNAWCEIGERLGITFRPAYMLDDLRKISERDLSPSAIRTVLWAGLVHEDPDLTEQEVGRHVDFENVGEIVRGFFEHLGEISGALAQEVTAAASLIEEDEKQSKEATTTTSVG